MLRGIGDGGKGRIPVKKSGATVAGEQFAFAELIPCLGSDAHAATGALLIFNTGNARASGGAEAVEAREPFRLNEGAESITLGGEAGLLAVYLSLAKANMLASLVESSGEQLNLSAGSGEGGFLGFSALQAGESLVFQALGLGHGKVELVLVGRGLIGGGEGVLLVAIAGGLLTVSGDFALHAGAEGVFAAEGGGSLGGLALGGGEGGLGLRNFCRQGARGQCKGGTLQLHRLQLYEIFNVRMHLCYEVYGIRRVFIK